MQSFKELFPKIETWSLQVKKHKILPEGHYGFLEYYCGNPACDCQNCLIRVIKFDPQTMLFEKELAKIRYAWGMALSEQNPQIWENYPESELTKAALKVFTNLLQNNTEDINYLKNHYEMVKDYFIQNPDKLQLLSAESKLKVGRNDPCPCGSGKKYKKCCL